MTYGAFGLVEVLGEANAVLVLDRMLKTAEVFYETQDTKCGGHALIFVSGSVSAVTAAVESVKLAPPCKVFQTAVISNPSQEMVQIVEGFKARNKKVKERMKKGQQPYGKLSFFRFYAALVRSDNGRKVYPISSHFERSSSIISPLVFDVL